MPAGRPTSVTDEARQTFLEQLEAGNYRVTAAAVAGFSYSAFLRYVRLDTPEAKQFRRAIKRAEALAESKIVNVLHRLAVEEDVDAAKWYLTHKFPDRWGARRELLKTLNDLIKQVEAAKAALDSAGSGGGRPVAGPAAPAVEPQA
jgi:hypothetical protein